MRTPVFIDLHHPDQSNVRTELLDGLTSPVARISPKYFYDKLGSQLFGAITELPEYYLTRTEAGIFATHGQAMLNPVPPGATLIDLGAGDCVKATQLFPLLQPARYVAVDISVDFLRGALDNLQRHHPLLDILGVGVDFSAGLTLPTQAIDRHNDVRVLFYPGSSIGNFSPGEALSFLRSVHAACGVQSGSGLLVGVDLIKAATELEAAYDDALGVTAAFNRNLLLHVNRLCDTNFQLPDWRHVAFFNAAASRIEMHLQATRTVTVRWADGARVFALGERIHTENSYKWTLDGFTALLRQAGFSSCRHWTDRQRRFAVFWADK